MVHGESGDGGVTAEERRTLEACPDITIVTIPGPSWFTPNEEPALVADLVVEALRPHRLTARTRPRPRPREDVPIADLDGAPVRLAELVAALSLGIDLGFGQPMEHVLRQCRIALRIGERVELDEVERVGVYYSALLVNVGATPMPTSRPSGSATTSR